MAVVKDTISDVIITTANAKASFITTVGLTAPKWVEYLEVIINPAIAFMTAVAAFLYMAFKAINAFHEWYFLDWKKRTEEKKRISGEK